MALKPSQITRRNFVQRAGLLVSALGVGAGVQSGLMDAIVKKANRKWGGEAMAAESGAVVFHVEVLFRAGFQMNSLFPSKGHTDASRNAALNIYSSQANIRPISNIGVANTAANPVYFAKYTAGAGADALATYFSSSTTNKNNIGIATSEAIQLQNGNHTSNFASRAPNSSAPAPAVLHAAVGKPAPITGVEWNNGVSTTNQRGNLAALATVKDQTTFQSLYKDLPMYFTHDELALIAGTFDANTGSLTKGGVIDSFDSMFAARNVPGSADVAQVSLAGRNQAQLSVLQLLQAKLTTASANFTNINQSMGGTQLGVALANAAAAFSAGLLTTMTVSLDSSDWHGDIPGLDDPTSKQGTWNTYVGNALTGFVKAMDSLTSPLLNNNSSPMSTSFLVSLGSEFTRTPNRNGSGAGNDNGDGGNGAMAFIGSNVKSGSFGNITNQGAVQGFDPTTGAISSANVTEAMMWKTQGKLLGISDATLNMYVPDTMAKAATAIVR